MFLDAQRCVLLTDGDGSMIRPASLCEIAFKPAAGWAADAARKAGISKICAVTDRKSIGEAANCEVLIHHDGRLTAGHALMRARDFWESGEHVLVLYGDAPLLDAETLTAFFAAHVAADNAATVLPEWLDTEEGDFESRAAACWFRVADLLTLPSPESAVDIDALAATLSATKATMGYYRAKPLWRSMRVRDSVSLMAINSIAIQLTIEQHLSNGVFFIARDGIVIGPDVQIESGATILPGSMLLGNTRIGAGSVIGPNSFLRDTEVGQDSAINASQAIQSIVGSGVTLGPFSHLRAGSVIHDHVKIGDFVEIKNSNIGEGTSVAHLTYVGDADIGRHCNFGCGVVFVNYDGEKKNRTAIGDYAFIGCNTNLIAPVQLGNGAYTAAGVTVTCDVPDGALAVGRARQENKPGRGRQKLESYITKKQKNSE